MYRFIFEGKLLERNSNSLGSMENIGRYMEIQGSP
jgi:hypothetical protein